MRLPLNTSSSPETQIMLIYICCIISKSQVLKMSSFYGTYVQTELCTYLWYIPEVDIATTMCRLLRYCNPYSIGFNCIVQSSLYVQCDIWHWTVRLHPITVDSFVVWVCAVPILIVDILFCLSILGFLLMTSGLVQMMSTDLCYICLPIVLTI